jgi:hypothetical protein
MSKDTQHELPEMPDMPIDPTRQSFTVNGHFIKSPMGMKGDEAIQQFVFESPVRIVDDPNDAIQELLGKAVSVTVKSLEYTRIQAAKGAEIADRDRRAAKAEPDAPAEPEPSPILEYVDADAVRYFIVEGADGLPHRTYRAEAFGEPEVFTEIGGATDIEDAKRMLRAYAKATGLTEVVTKWDYEDPEGNLFTAVEDDGVWYLDVTPSEGQEDRIKELDIPTEPYLSEEDAREALMRTTPIRSNPRRATCSWSQSPVRRSMRSPIPSPAKASARRCSTPMRLSMDSMPSRRTMNLPNLPSRGRSKNPPKRSHSQNP